MRLIAFATVFVLAIPCLAAEQARILRCPPNLDYCYYEMRSVEPRLRREDADAQYRRDLEELDRRIENARRLRQWYRD